MVIFDLGVYGPNFVYLCSPPLPVLPLPPPLPSASRSRALNNRLNEYTCEVVAAGSGPRAWATPPRALHRVRKACCFGGGHAEAPRLEVPASTGICGGQAWSYSIGGSGAAQVVPRGLRGSKKRIRAGGKGCQRGAQATPKAPKTSRSSLRRQCPLVGARTRAGKGAISSQKGARVSQKES